MKVTQFINRRGNPVANHFVMFHNGQQIFQSYETVVAKIDSKGKVSLSTNSLNYPVTTSKHLADFLGYESATELRKDLKNNPDKFNIVNNF